MSGVSEVILATATLVAAVTAAIISLRNAFKITSVHKQINSRQDEWVKAAVEAGVAAAGNLERERIRSAVETGVAAALVAERQRVKDAGG